MRFRLKKNTEAPGAAWLNRETVYDGKLMSATTRLVRLFSPNPGETRPHVDVPFDWVTQVR